MCCSNYTLIISFQCTLQALPSRIIVVVEDYTTRLVKKQHYNLILESLSLPSTKSYEWNFSDRQQVLGFLLSILWWQLKGKKEQENLQFLQSSY